MRYADFALLLVPVALLVAYFVGLRGLSARGIIAALAALAIIGAALVLLGEERGFTGHYQPAHLQDGRVAPGHPG